MNGGLRSTREPVDGIIALELVRLDELLRAWWHAAIGGDAAAAGIVLRICERRARMLGLDGPRLVNLDLMIRREADESAAELGLDAEKLVQEAKAILERNRR